jgi:hypothetical protein
MEWGKEGGGADATIADLATWGQTCLGILRQGDWLDPDSGQALGYTANVACNPKTGAVIAYALNSTEGPLDLSSGLASPLGRTTSRRRPPRARWCSRPGLALASGALEHGLELRPR